MLQASETREKYYIILYCKKVIQTAEGYYFVVMMKKLPSGLEFHGWRVETHKGTILNTEEMDKCVRITCRINSAVSYCYCE